MTAYKPDEQDSIPDKINFFCFPSEIIHWFIVLSSICL
jgi:hypothetical protein